MYNLVILQKQIATYLKGKGELQEIGAFFSTDSEETLMRLKIYQDSILYSLQKILVSTYQACQKILGTPFFNSLTESYIQQHMPHSPELTAYGESFPSFLTTHSVTPFYPYLPDLARLEWECQQVFYGPNNPETNMSALAQAIATFGDQIVLSPLQGVRYFSAHYPVGHIWKKIVENQLVEMVDKDETYLLIFQREETVQLGPLTQDEFIFMQAMKSEKTLIELCESLSTVFGSTLISSLLVSLCQRGYISIQTNQG